MRSLLLVVTILFASLLSAQELKPQSPKQRALDSLASAETAILHMSPPVKSGLCMQIMNAYIKTEYRQDLIRMAKTCFRAATELADDKALRRERELSVVSLLGSTAPEELPDLEQLAEPEVRSAIEGLLFRADVKAKRFDEAMARVNALAHAKGFPYDPASQLMLALPDERVADKRAVFFAAMQSYHDFPDTTEDRMPRHNDMATFILQFWRQMPANAVTDAVDLLLKNAQASSQSFSIPLTLKNSSGEAAFDSAYKMRLFELLPVLKELEPSKARELERDQTMNQTLAKYPNGLQSFEPSYSSTSPDEFNSMSIMYGPAKSNRTQDDADDIMVNAVLTLADSDLPAALRKAPTLSTLRDSRGSSARVRALEGIVQKSWEKDPVIAKSALRQEIDAVQYLERINRCGYYIDALALYYTMGEKDDAARMLDRISALASDFYTTDSAGPPSNVAVKLEWPSTTMWRVSAVFSTEMWPNVEPEVMKRIQDDEILLSLQIAIANELLGNPPGGMYMTVTPSARQPAARKYIQVPQLRPPAGS